MKALQTATLSFVMIAVAATQALAGGSITGKVLFDGEPPNRRQVKMDADPACAQANPEPRLGEVMVISANKEIANTFVYIKDGLSGEFDVPAEAAQLDQNGCMYSPHVLGVMVGQTLEIKNSDATLHNVHSLPKNSKQFNNAMPLKDSTIKKKFTSEEVMVRMKCDVHPWMSAYIGVLSHPFHAVSSEDGTFTIEGLPAGTYTVAAWHERLGTQEASVTVADGAAATADFTFAPSK